MKVLLLGEFSSLHYTLAQGLKQLGIDITVASNGDFWKNIPRDIDINQPKKFKKITFPIKLLKNLPHLLGYDVVQVISPNFLMSSPQFTSLFFDILKLNNGKFFLCACGMEYSYIKYALDHKVKYSVFYNPEVQNDPFIQNLISLAEYKPFINLEKKVASKASGIIATSNGYYHAFKNSYPDKTHFIPLPINTDEYQYINTITANPLKIKFFVGLMKQRVKLKGTDVILRILEKLKKNYPDDMELIIVDSVPYLEYVKLLNSTHILLDQRYAYGVGMNGLIAMSKGLIVGGGADNEMYDFLGEDSNRPIIDLNLSEDKIYESFEALLHNKKQLVEHAINSRKFVIDNYNYVKVAQQYIDFWNSK